MLERTSSPIVASVEGAAAVIRLDRPEALNAFTFAMIDEIRRAVDAAAADDAVAGLVLTGTGRAFSAGLDAGDLARSAGGSGPSAGPRREGELPALFSHLLTVPKPVIAAVNGVCAGGGVVLAMMCDLRFAAPEAAFVTAFAQRGLIAEHGTGWFLPRLVGTSAALDLLWSSRRVEADEALRLGLVDRLVPADDLLAEALAYVERLAATVSPRSVATMKAQVYAGLSLPADAALAQDHARMQASLLHPDATEGVQSFVERRPPRFAPLGGFRP